MKNLLNDIDPYMKDFFTVFCEIKPGYVLKFKVLFSKYQQFVLDQGAIPVPYKTFRKNFLELDPHLKISKFNTAYVLQNIKLKN